VSSLDQVGHDFLSDSHFALVSLRYVVSNTNNHWVEIEVWGKANTTFVGNCFEWTILRQRAMQDSGRPKR
jgi:hypothetical protein